MSDFALTLWTDDPALAREADAAGIDRIGVDLDRLGKADRQRGRATWISPHRAEALSALGPALTDAALFARVDPLNPDSGRQVEDVIARGAEILMLPMVATAEEACSFSGLVAGRASIVLLVERIEAIERLAEMTSVAGVDEIHLGLNDLAMSLGLSNRWLVLAGDVASEAAATTLAAGLRFGLGGIGRAADTALPVPPELVYAEFARTGATGALISRSFLRGSPSELATEVRRAREALASWRERSPEELERAHAELLSLIHI